MRKVLDRFRPIDLTHPLNEHVPTWSGGCGFHLDIKLDYPQGLRVQSLKSHAGVGTHIDAPTHFIKDSWNIGDIPLENLIVPVSVLNISHKMDPNLFISPADIEAFEEAHGRIHDHSLFLAYTGWSQFWSNPMKYRNPDASGRMHFPGFSKEAAALLLKRNIVGLGIDTLSPDGSNNGPGVQYPVHEIILGAKKYIIENVAHLDQMPPVGAYAIALPPRVSQATESAARLVGLINWQ
jgi:kynurenine formamidase